MMSEVSFGPEKLTAEGHFTVLMLMGVMSVQIRSAGVRSIKLQFDGQQSSVT